MPIDVSQVYRLAADLGKAGAKVTVLAGRVVAKTAQDIEGTAKGFVRVDTGALKNSIGIDHYPLGAVIGPTLDYGPPQEYGTARMAPQPYMGPAMDTHERAFHAALEAAAAQALD